MRGLNLDQLQTLVAIADLGTFAAAAQALHLAPPTVSLHVSELESRLGAPLLERGPRRATPTAAGEALLAHARRLLKAADDAADAVRRVAQGLAGKVRLGTSSGALVHLLPQVLQTLAAQAPEVDVELLILGSDEAMARLQAGTLEVALLALPQPSTAEVEVTPWRSEPVRAFVPAAWRPPRVVTPDWLAARPLIFNDSTTRLYRATMAWFAQAGHSPRARIELNYLLAVRSLVAAGYGAALLPLAEAGGDTPGADDDTRVVVRPLKPPMARQLGIAHRPEPRLDAAAREVLAALRRLAPPAAAARRTPRR